MTAPTGTDYRPAVPPASGSSGQDRCCKTRPAVKLSALGTDSVEDRVYWCAPPAANEARRGSRRLLLLHKRIRIPKAPKVLLLCPLLSLNAATAGSARTCDGTAELPSSGCLMLHQGLLRHNYYSEFIDALVCVICREKLLAGPPLLQEKPKRLSQLPDAFGRGRFDQTSRAYIG